MGKKLKHLSFVDPPPQKKTKNKGGRDREESGREKKRGRGV